MQVIFVSVVITLARYRSAISEEPKRSNVLLAPLDSLLMHFRTETPAELVLVQEVTQGPSELKNYFDIDLVTSVKELVDCQKSSKKLLKGEVETHSLEVDKESVELLIYSRRKLGKGELSNLPVPTQFYGKVDIFYAHTIYIYRLVLASRHRSSFADSCVHYSILPDKDLKKYCMCRIMTPKFSLNNADVKEFLVLSDLFLVLEEIKKEASHEASNSKTSGSATTCRDSNTINAQGKHCNPFPTDAESGSSRGNVFSANNTCDSTSASGSKLYDIKSGRTYMSDTPSGAESDAKLEGQPVLNNPGCAGSKSADSDDSESKECNAGSKCRCSKCKAELLKEFSGFFSIENGCNYGLETDFGMKIGKFVLLEQFNSDLVVVNSAIIENVHGILVCIGPHDGSPASIKLPRSNKFPGWPALKKSDFRKVSIGMSDKGLINGLKKLSAIKNREKNSVSYYYLVSLEEVSVDIEFGSYVEVVALFIHNWKQTLALLSVVSTLVYSLAI